MILTQGIDVSTLQGDIDFSAVKAAGYDFVVVKTTEGLHYRDPRRLLYLEAARKAGLLVGVYHFARVSQGRPEDQFRALWDGMGDTMPEMRFVLDLENAPDGMPSEQIVEFGARWAAEAVRYRPLLPPLLYTYPAFARTLERALVGTPAGLELGLLDLWIAHYRWFKPGLPPDGVRPFVPKPWSTWKMWQVSGGGDPKHPELDGPRVPGVPWVVDRNVFAGSLEELRAWCGLPTSPPSDDTIRVIHPWHFGGDEPPDDAA